MAIADKEREAKWAAASDAEARGALRTASKLYDEYAKSYPGSKQAALATAKAKSLLAQLEARKAAQPPAAPTTPPP